MRYQDTDEMTIGTKRTLKALRGALTELLKVKPLEKISIQELCDIAMISRGTFYNYFYDKYDLLNYDWKQIQLQIDPKFADTNLKPGDYEEYMNILLKNLINYLSEERELYQMIINNNANSIFSVNMHEYIGEQIFIKLKEVIDMERKAKIPLELLATIYANTIMTVGKWWLKFGEDYSKEEVYNFFTILIANNLVESKN